jgi:hypothetical protein
VLFQGKMSKACSGRTWSTKLRCSGSTTADLHTDKSHNQIWL